MMKNQTASYSKKPSYSKDKLASFLFMIKSVSQGLGQGLPVILTTNGSVLPVSGMAIMFLFQKVNNHLATLTLFQKGCYGYLVMPTC